MPHDAPIVFIIATLFVGAVVILALRLRHHARRERELTGKMVDQGNAIAALQRERDHARRLFERERLEGRRLAQLSRAANEGFCLCDLDGRIEWVNPAWERITGYQRREAIGRKPSALLHGPDTDPATVQRLREAIRARRPIVEQIRNYTKDKRPIWLELDIRPLHSPEGKVEGFLGVERDLTPEHAERERLAGRVARAEEALASSGDGTWEWLPKADKLEWSQLCLELHGLASTPPGYEAWMTLVHRDDRPGLESLLRSALLGHREIDAQVRLAAPELQDRRVALKGRVVRAPDGEVIRVIGIARDVSAEFEVRNQLRLAVERLRLALQGASDGTWEWRREGDRFELDELWQQVTRTAQPDRPLAREEFERFFHPEDLAVFRAALEGHAAGRSSQLEVSCRVAKAQGEWAWIRWRGTAVEHDASGLAARLCGTYSDVTAHHKTEAALRRSALFLRQMCQQLGIAAWEIDAQSFEIHWTEELDLLHATPADFEPNVEAFLALYPPDSRRELSKALMAAIEKGAGFDLEVRWAPRGSTKTSWFRWTGNPVLSGGRVQAVCGLIQDVTSARDAALQRREMDQRLSELRQYEALSAMTDDLAYDLNSLLGSMLGYQELACEDLPAGHKAREFLEEAMRTTNRTHDIIRQVLLLNRVKPAARIGLRLPMLAEEVCRTLADGLPDSVTIEKAIDPHCPPVHGDAAQLQQVFTHVASLAEGFLLGRTGTLEVRLRHAELSLDDAARVGLALAGECACFEVCARRDHMDEAEWIALFGEEADDPGLNLTAARKIVADHQGGLWAFFDARRGGVCQIWLPLAHTLQGAPPASEPVPMGAGEAVWIVDEERFISRLASLCLERNGYATRVFRSAPSLLAALAEDPAACRMLLIGSALPQTSVGEFVAAARRHRPGLAAVRLSGAGEEAEAGPWLRLREPFTAADLVRAVHEALHPAKEPEGLFGPADTDGTRSAG